MPTLEASQDTQFPVGTTFRSVFTHEAGRITQINDDLRFVEWGGPTRADWHRVNRIAEFAENVTLPEAPLEERYAAGTILRLLEPIRSASERFPAGAIVRVRVPHLRSHRGSDEQTHGLYRDGSYVAVERLVTRPGMDTIDLDWTWLSLGGMAPAVAHEVLPPLVKRDGTAEMGEQYIATGPTGWDDNDHSLIGQMVRRATNYDGHDHYIDIESLDGERHTVVRRENVRRVPPIPSAEPAAPAVDLATAPIVVGATLRVNHPHNGISHTRGDATVTSLTPSRPTDGDIVARFEDYGFDYHFRSQDRNNGWSLVSLPDQPETPETPEPQPGDSVDARLEISLILRGACTAEPSDLRSYIRSAVASGKRYTQGMSTEIPAVRLAQALDFDTIEVTEAGRVGPQGFSPCCESPIQYFAETTRTYVGVSQYDPERQRWVSQEDWTFDDTVDSDWSFRCSSCDGHIDQEDVEEATSDEYPYEAAEEAIRG